METRTPLWNVFQSNLSNLILFKNYKNTSCSDNTYSSLWSALSQKPTVIVPLLIEGQQASLTCTAPGQCSGSDPKITWKWTGIGKDESHITGNMSVEKLTDLSGKMSSTLTFNTLAEFHGTNVTCSVSYRNNITTNETVTLNVICE